MVKHFLIDTTVTFVFFFTEALIHFNLGKKSEDGAWHLSFPWGYDLLVMVGTVLLFSAMTSFVTTKIIKRLEESEKRKAS